MKKIGVFVLFACLITALASCEETNKEEPKTIKEAVSLYYGELSELLIEDHKNRNKLTSTHQESTTNEDKFISRETLLDVYETLDDDTFDVNLSTHLSYYQRLLNQLRLKLENDTTTKKTYEGNLETNQGTTVLFKVTLTEDGNLVFDYNDVLSNGKDENAFVASIKMGFDDNDFYLNELRHIEEINGYDYFEFIEQQSIHQISYSNENNYQYKADNLKTNQYASLLVREDFYKNVESTIVWINSDNQTRTILRNGINRTRQLALYNEHGMVFTYADDQEEQINLWFQLLEATGWDRAYFDTSDDLNVGVYKDGLRLFSEGQYKDFNSNFDALNKQASYGVFIELAENELSNDILNLSAYQLAFYDNKVTKEWVSSVLDGAYTEASSLMVYQDVDFTNASTILAFFQALTNE